METVRHILQLKGYYLWQIDPDAPVYDALRIMADKDVGALLVMKEDKLVGIISERDYARKVILQGKSSRETPVREIMTANVHTIHPDQTVDEAMTLMHQAHVRHLPVVENEGEVIGMISIGDVVRMVIQRQRRTIRNMEDRMRTSAASW
ncbi:MAG TPA: CBS domain-containing protein [Anaerolineaceae bacterium]